MFLAAAALPSLPAQVRWKPTDGLPPIRSAPGMCYDSVRQAILLFGGMGRRGEPLDDTLELQASGWHRRTSLLSPPARREHVMVFDSVRSRAVLFGGRTAATTTLGDTWEWDGVQWIQPATSSSPSPRFGHAMAFDATRGCTVLFGGLSGNLQNDTWEWDGVNWTQRQPAAQPGPRSGHALAYDVFRGRLVLFGGTVQVGTPGLLVDDTWEWDGSNWARRLPAVRPSARIDHAMAYDFDRQRVVLHGGLAAAGTAADSWEYDGTQWQQVVGAGPPPRQGHSLAFDPARHQLVLFGGGHVGAELFGDTWELGPDQQWLGGGCAGSNGGPLLSALSALRIGGQFATELYGLHPAAALAGFVVGGSTTVTAAGPLPLDLTRFGLTGCALSVAPEAVVLQPVAGGVVRLVIDVPVVAGLIGLALREQGLSIEPGVNPAGIVLSNAIAATVRY